MLGKLFRISLYTFSFLLPFENILGQIRFGFLGGVKVFGLLILYLLILYIVESRKKFNILIKNLLNPISVILFLFIMWNMMSVVWAPKATWALTRVYTYIGLFTIMQAVGLLKRHHIKIMWVCLLIGAALSVPVGFILPPPSELIAASGRFSSGGQNPNDYANLIVITAIVGWFGILTEVKRQLVRLSLMGAALIALMAVPFTLSRTALITFIVIVAISFLSRRNLRTSIKLTLIISIFTPLILVLYSDRVEQIIQRYSTLESIQQEDTWAGRIDLWRTAIMLFNKHPVTGVGAANFAYISPHYSYEAARIAATREDGGGGVAHNMFLSVLSETGLIGLFLFGALLSFAYRSAWYLAKNKEALGYGLLLALIAYTIAGMTLTWEYVKIPYVIYGSLLALRREVNNAQGTRSPHPPQLWPRRGGALGA